MTAAMKSPPVKAGTVAGPLALGRTVTAAWNSEAHVDAGLTWDEFCLAHLAEMRAVGPTLGVGVRRTLVKAMRLARMSEQAIADALGVSKSTVHKDRIEINDPDEPERVWGVDGRSRAAGDAPGRALRLVARPTVEVETELQSQAELAMSNRDYVVYLVREHEPRGLTAREFDQLVDWHRSNLSGTLSHVERQQRLRRNGLRNGMGVYHLGPAEQDPQTPE